MMPITLDSQNVKDYVAQHIIPHLPLEISELVSVNEVTEQTYVNWIFAVKLQLKSGQKQTVYLRQSRGFVKSKPDMAMEPARIAFEVKILEKLQLIIPGTVPKVLYFDAQNNVAVLSDIKLGGKLLVNELVAGRVHPNAGSYFGATIAKVHLATQGISNKQVRGSKESNDKAIDFHMGMRLKPALQMYPKETQLLLKDSRSAPHCMVLGDLASKNIFVQDETVTFLDLERAFIGDPAFDIAFLFCHYLIEIPPTAVQDSILFMQNFLDAYLFALSKSMNQSQLEDLQNRLIRFLGVTILYRIYGFYLAVNVEGRKDYWQKIASKLLNTRTETSVINALRNHMAIKRP